MALTTSALQGYQTTPSTSIYNVLIGAGSSTSLSSTLLGSADKAKALELSDSQKSVITGLQDFVKNNLTGAEADKLKESIAKLETMMKNNNLTNSYTDTISQLFGGNGSMAKSLQSGGLINQLF